MNLRFNISLALQTYFWINIFIGLRQCTAVVGNLHTLVLLLTIFCRELSNKRSGLVINWASAPGPFGPFEASLLTNKDLPKAPPC